MVKRHKTQWRPRAPRPVQVDSILTPLLHRLGFTPLKARLASLWRQWDTVLGPDLAPLARPLGAKNSTLLLAAADSLLIQELHFLSADILERVNAFLGDAAFTDVRAVLGEGKICPEENFAHSPQLSPAPPRPRRTRLSGQFLALMDPNSPIARCYARFVEAAKNRL